MLDFLVRFHVFRYTSLERPPGKGLAPIRHAFSPKRFCDDATEDRPHQSRGAAQ